MCVCCWRAVRAVLKSRRPSLQARPEFLEPARCAVSDATCQAKKQMRSFVEACVVRFCTVLQLDKSLKDRKTSECSTKGQVGLIRPDCRLVDPTTCEKSITSLMMKPNYGPTGSVDVAFAWGIFGLHSQPRGSERRVMWKKTAQCQTCF